MKILTAALLMLFATAAHAQTVKVIVPHGIIVEVETLGKPGEPVEVQEPHWRVTEAESQGTDTVKGMNAFTRTIRHTHLTHAEATGEVGSSCTTFINKRWPQNPGIVVAHSGGAKHCYAIPKNGAAAWLYELGPGTHPQPVNIWSRLPWIVQGVREAGNNLTTIDCVYKNMFRGDQSQRKKTCIGGRNSHDITVRNIDVTLARFKDGMLLTTGLANDSFRCIMPGDGHLLVENVGLFGCKHGIQGLPGKTWTLRNVRIENASAKGSGLRHGVYTDALDLLLIEDSNLHSRAGNVVKSRAAKTIIRRSTLTEGGGDTGVAVQTHGGELVLEDVTLIQPPSKGNTRIIQIGGRNGARCVGTGSPVKYGTVTLTRVAINDNDPEPNKPRFENTCGRTEFKDGGGNTYSHMGGAPRNLFKDGRVDLKGVQP